MVSSAYLRLLIFLPAILIPACASSSPAFLMMYSAYKLNKQGDSIQPWCTPFPISNQAVVPRPVLTVASWPAYSFLKRQVRWSGIPISFRIFHSLLWSTQSKAVEDPYSSPELERSPQKGMATYFSFLSWRIPWTEETGALQSMVSQRVRHNWATNTFTFLNVSLS